MVVPTYARLPVEFVRGEGARLWDDEGNEYLDFLSGISVTSVGHCHPRVVEAIREQAGRLTHTTNLFYTEPPMRLAARLSQALAGGKVVLRELRRRGDRVRRSSSPAGPRPRRRDRGVRGRLPRAHLRRALGDPSGVQAGAVRAARSRDSWSCPRLRRGPGARRWTDRTAAVLARARTGRDGRVAVWPDELLEGGARRAATQWGAALIFDETSRGMGRTGTLWAYEQTPVVPDAMTLAKALGGGLPIGALVSGIAPGRRPASPATTGRRSPAARSWLPPRTPRST